MHSPLSLSSPTLEIARFPVDKRETLLPYEAADELIMEWWLQQDKRATECWLVNDSFGALTCFFHQQSTAQLSHMTDSFLARQAMLNNLAHNQLDSERVCCFDCIEPWQGQPDLIVLKVPKNLTLLQYQLARISQLTAGTPVLIAARLKDLPAKAIKLLKQAFGNMVPEPAKRKSRIMHASVTGTPMVTPEALSWEVPEFQLTLSNQANVFSRKSLDIGARFFLEHLPKAKPGSHVVDLGCGNGVLALAMASQQPENQYHLVDESFMAVASAQANQHTNLPELAKNFHFYCQHSLTGMAEESIDWVICNPPFHQQQAITDEIAWQMFTQAYRTLRPGGKLRIVGNRHLGYHVKLKRIFGGAKVLASNAKFVILESEKRA